MDRSHCEPIEVDARDDAILQRIGSLRVRAWRAVGATTDPRDCWLDDFDHSCRHWVVLENGEPVAAARLSTHHALSDAPDAAIFDGVFSPPPAGPIGSFNRLVVDPAYRGTGLSRVLDHRRMEAAIESGCRSVILETHSGQFRVAQLSGLGFRVVGRSRPYPQDHFCSGREGIVLCRDLGFDGSGSVLRTANQMGWSSNVLNEISAAFVIHSSNCSGPMLDIGAAYGVATIPALAVGATVCAFDLAAEHLEELRARTPLSLRERLATVQGRFPGSVEFASESFAAIHCSQVLHFLNGDEVTEGLEAAFRWLQPGGMLYVVAATPYQSTHSGFIPEFIRRKKDGDPWPGMINSLHEYNHHWSAVLNPSRLHVFDVDTLAGAARRAGFVVESARLFSRRGLPDFCRLDGRENVGMVAAKPV